ncbi:HDOD domain-containing protein [Methylomonas rapida]|uniref:HDOD domain-containing protein n=1 Tax=Methylomonas rapida TaxID=2963939 RepID=A0ABY7GGH2_9GAMM|nr:HDOD domain-containing protein [Methylomonas rapida]WAR44355.1 HDOD domain-containing protein [Methylomonas rapida]
MIISAPTLNVTDLLRGDIQLASPPTIYWALNKVIDDPAKTVRDAAIVIESDAALAARLLKIVNSAFYGFPGKINSIATAITLIGTRELQNLALAAIVIERFSDLPGQLFSIHDFWARNLRCALIARELDALSGKKFADTAFLCGLLHNIGQLVLYRRIPVLAREVDLLIQSQASDDVDEVAIEQQVIGFDHFQLGAALCRLWKLPDVVVESILLHDHPGNNSPHAHIADIVRTANLFGKIDSVHSREFAHALPLSPEQISQILDKTHDEFEVIFSLFYPSK